ncbi:MAG: alpha-amylase/4-alpha-glucanotransferase domain-containing protein [Candidatus Zixiibacteriota bacterium]
MPKFRLAIALHNHQPVGNFDSVFEDAHNRAYAPFFDLVKGYPEIRLSLHQSGILWQWQQKSHPEYCDLIRDLHLDGRIELMTGGYYEPILTSIPQRDTLGQIGLLNNYLNEQFEVTPTGLWLTERIWEPHLPQVLHKAGVQYLPIDDTHFEYAGFSRDDLSGSFVTEHEGYAIRLLPIQKRLRYLIPFATVDEVIAELKRQAKRNPEGVAVYADDGEKFGIWPQTWKHCYEDRWLEQFFQALQWNSDWLEVITLGEAAAMEPIGRAYLPSASYAEMLHWSLPTDAYLEYEQFENDLKNRGDLERYGRFVRGGHWRGFLTKYEESNLIHKKMLAVSDKLARAEECAAQKNSELQTAREKLYAGQCNCPYWHGVFGGIYLPHLRQAVCGSLIEADSILDKVLGDKMPNVMSRDYDADGHEETIVTSDSFSAVFAPRRGGMLIDLAMNRHGFDLTDTLSRRREGYHAKVNATQAQPESDGTASIHDLIQSKEDGLEKLLVEDWYLRRCFIDHFFGPDVDRKSFLTASYQEDGDFILEPYSCQTTLNSHSLSVHLSRDGMVRSTQGQWPVVVTKSFMFDKESDIIRVRYDLSTAASRPINVRFAIENNLTFQAGHADDRYVTIDRCRPDESWLDTAAEHESIHSWQMLDSYRHLAVSLHSSRTTTLWRSPIWTVSLSESGLEKVYQGTTFVNCYKLVLTSRPETIELTFAAGSIESVESLLSATVSEATAHR